MSDFWYFVLLVFLGVMAAFCFKMAKLAEGRAMEWKALSERSKSIATRLEADDVSSLEYEYLTKQLDIIIQEGIELDQRSIFGKRTKARTDIPPL